MMNHPWLIVVWHLNACIDDCCYYQQRNAHTMVVVDDSSYFDCYYLGGGTWVPVDVVVGSVVAVVAHS